MPRLEGNRMRKGMGANTRSKRIRRQTIEVKLAGPGTDETSFCDQIAQLSIVLPKGIAERHSWAAQKVLEPIFASSNFIPCTISSELWEWHMAQCESTHLKRCGSLS